MKIVIEAGAEVTLKAGGSFVKVDPSGVTVSGPLVRMNSGGGPGSGRGVGAQIPAVPWSLGTRSNSDIESSSVAVVDERMNGSAAALSFSSIFDEMSAALSRAAKIGNAFVSPCRFDALGNCDTHNHDTQNPNVVTLEQDAGLKKTRNNDQVNMQGAPITEEQLALASAGKFMEFWRSRHLAGDPVARTALTGWGDPEFVNAGPMQRLAANHTWSDLTNYIHDHELDISMEQIGADLAIAHAFAVDNDTDGIANLLSPQQVAEYHHEVFGRYGIPAYIFGGTHNVPLVYVPVANGWQPVMFDANSYSNLWCDGCDTN